MNDFVSSSPQMRFLPSGANRSAGVAQALENFEQWLVSGGDERIAVNPGSGRNRYGTPRGKAFDEAWFSSSTAVAISPRGYDAAFAAYSVLASASDGGLIPAWFDRIRTRLVSLFGIEDSEVVLSSSGTEIEFIALVLARSISGRAVTNLIVAPHETGKGVVLAASGRYFLGSTALKDEVEQGALLEGCESYGTLTGTIEIRDGQGIPRALDSIDEEMIQQVEKAVAQGRCALIHLLDCSKTNRSGLRRTTASRLLKKYPGRLFVIVDSCQLRCTAEQIRHDLAAGFMVMITGSKFAGGPPFAGALLLPSSVIDQVRLIDLPRGLLAYTAAEDWPRVLRSKMHHPFAVTENIGAGLRWEAALAEAEKVFALPIEFRESVAQVFANTVKRHVSSCPDLTLADKEPPPEMHLPATTIFPIFTMAEGTRALPSDQIHRALRSPLSDGRARSGSKEIFHVGQPVQIGDRDALRVCLSAPHVVDIAEAVAKGRTFERAIEPLAADLEHLFSKWLRVADDLKCRL